MFHRSLNGSRARDGGRAGRSLAAVALATVAVAAAGCQDLVVPNLNDPDRFRALANPGDVEALIASAFDEYFESVHTTGNGVTLFPVYGTESEYTSIAGAVTTEAAEPRQAHANLVSIASVIGAHGPREFYKDMLAVWSIGDDLMRVTTGPKALKLIIDDVDQTPRAQAIALMMEGFALGQMANMYDQAIAIASDEPFPESTAAALEYLIPADEVLEKALRILEQAKDVLEANPSIVFPDRSAGSDQWFGTPTPVGPAELIPFINTMAARFIIMHARSPAERAALDWNRVLGYTNAGLTEDFNIVLDGSRSSAYLHILQRTSPGPFAIDNRLIGQADTTGAYQTWIASSLDARRGFDIGTPDRRLVGVGTVTASGTAYPAQGAYARYHIPKNCCAGGGVYRETHYQWRRHAHSVGNTSATTGSSSNNTGLARISGADENRLYAAEAHYHLGNLAQARDLVNVTRTRVHTPPNGVSPAGLPAATVNGAPHSGGFNNCVPRTDAGACGNLLVVIRYERMIELMGQDITRGYLDSRGFGLLPDDSWTELPVPAPELEQLGLALYQFGGPDDPNGAVYAPVGGANASP